MEVNVNDKIQIGIKGKILSFKVIGIMNKNMLNDDNKIYISLNCMQKADLLNDDSSNLQYFIKCDSNDEKQMIYNLSKRLKQAQVFNLTDALNELSGYIQNLAFVFILICCISIFAAVCLMGNIFMIINYERIKEFLVLKVVGAKNKDIREITIIEGIIIGGLSGVLGTLISEILGCIIMNSMFYSKYYPNIFIICGMIFIALIIAIISSLVVIANMKIENYSDMFRME